MSALASPSNLDFYQALALHDTQAFCDVYRPQVLHPIHGYVPFVPHNYQATLLDALDAGGQHVILKARQIGISTTIMAHFLRLCMAHAGTMLCVSRKERTAVELVRIARDMATRTATPLPITITTDNKTELGFNNGARIIAETSSPETGRTFAASAVLVDEFAFLPWQEEMWRSLRPTVSRGARVIIPSTPDMEGDLFEQQWQEAKSAGSRWHAHELPWQVCAEYDPDWYAENRPSYTQADWDQEFECKFGSAKDAVFRGEHIQRAQELGEMPWERTDSCTFAIGGDLAGSGRDYSVLVAIDTSTRPARVVDVRSWEVLPAPMLQDEIAKFADLYDADPWLDRTGIGWGIAQNVERRVVGVAFTGGTAEGGTADEPNIPRTKLITNLILGIEQGQLAIPAQWQEVLMGLRSYRWEKRKARYADHVDALALTWWAANVQPNVWWRVG